MQTYEQQLKAQYCAAWGDMHGDPAEEFDWLLSQFEPAQLTQLGRLLLAMGRWKQSYNVETLGVTRGTPLQDSDLAA